MTASRREFLEAGAATFCTGLALGATQVTAEDEKSDNRGSSAIRCLDYGLSFVCGTAAFNSVRFWVESRTTIFDDKTGTATEYCQCASCKSENTFGERDLFYKDNYDFLPILGDGRWLIFRRPARLSANYRQIRKVEEVWGVMNMKLREAAPVTVLDSWEKIRDATAAGLPIVTQTEIQNVESGLRAVIECPVKTMNISHDKRMYQVDTGPIAFPNLTKRFDPQIDCLSLAFIVFNAPNFADFVIEQPTTVVEDGVEKCQIYHFSSPFSMPAKNVVLALERT